MLETSIINREFYKRSNSIPNFIENNLCMYYAFLEDYCDLDINSF